MNKLILLLIIVWIVSIDSRYVRQQDIKSNPLILVWSMFHSNPGQTKFPENWPFEEKTMNYIAFVLSALVIVIILFALCCICFCLCCQSARYNETLVVSPSELIAVGATRSDLRAANITPSVLRDSGATYSQIDELGLIDSRLKPKSKKKPKYKEDVKFEKKSLSEDYVTDDSNKRSGHTTPKRQVPLKPEDRVRNRSNFSSNVDLLSNQLKDRPKFKKGTDFETKPKISKKDENEEPINDSSMAPNSKLDEMKVTNDNNSEATVDNNN